jgi:hypothetical protein
LLADLDYDGVKSRCPAECTWEEKELEEEYQQCVVNPCTRFVIEYFVIIVVVFITGFWRK